MSVGCINRHYKTPCLQSLFFRAFFMFALGMLPCTHHAATLNDLLAAEPQVSHPSQHCRSLSQSCTLSDSSSLLLPSNSDDISKELRQSSHSRNHIPHPRNAFMIFCSEFCAGEKISCSVERDHRHISWIIGYYWIKLPKSEKDVWQHKVEQEKSEHLQKYPSYLFTPTVHAKRPIKRNVKRNGEDDLLCCQILADFLMLGKEGKDLEDIAKMLEPSTEKTWAYVDCSIHDCFSENDKVQPFPPSSYSEIPGGNFVVQSSCYPGMTISLLFWYIKQWVLKEM